VVLCVGVISDSAGANRGEEAATSFVPVVFGLYREGEIHVAPLFSVVSCLLFVVRVRFAVLFCGK
jgi:hypothetical protein